MDTALDRGSWTIYLTVINALYWEGGRDGTGDETFYLDGRSEDGWMDGWIKDEKVCIYDMDGLSKDEDLRTYVMDARRRYQIQIR